MRNEQHRLVYIEQVRIVYSQSSTAIVGGSIVSVLFVWMFWNVSDHAVLLGWWACSQVVLLVRIVPYVAFNRRRDNSGIQRWGDVYAFLAFLQGSIWGAAWLILLPVSDPMYNVVAVTWIIGLTAASVSAYIAHLRSLLAFFVPVDAPGLAQLVAIGGRLHLGLALVVVIYIIVALRALIPINRSMIRAIGLNFKLEEEIRERQRVEIQLRELSLRDGLTGLSNRRHFDSTLDIELQRAQRHSQPLSLVLMDIDDFKLFNDTYGHVEGDECLRRLSALIEGAVKRTGDLAARYGGDELALILPDADAEDARRITEGMRQGVYDLAIPHESSSVEGCDRITISAGIATMMPDRDSVAADLVVLADEALYSAKRSGRNRTVG